MTDIHCTDTITSLFRKDNKKAAFLILEHPDHKNSNESPIYPDDIKDVIKSNDQITIVTEKANYILTFTDEVKLKKKYKWILDIKNDPCFVGQGLWNQVVAQSDEFLEKMKERDK